MRLWSGVDGHGTLNASEPPKVLPFQVGTVRPTLNLHCNLVFPWANDSAYIKFNRGLRALVVAQLLSVDPDSHAAGNRSETQDHAPSDPLRRNLEAALVAPERVVLARNMRRIRGKRVGNVQIDGNPIAVKLPVRGHRQEAPTRDVETWRMEIARPFIKRCRPVKSPFAIE